MPADFLFFIAIGLIVSLSFFFQRITGFGSAIIATPVLAMFWLPHDSIALMLIYQTVFGVVLIGMTWRMLGDPKLRWFQVVFYPGIIIGSYLLPGLPEEVVRLSLAIVTFIVLAQWVFKPAFRLTGWIVVPTAIVLGAASGVVSGAFGMGGPFFLAYYGSVEKKASNIRDATIAIFCIGNLLRTPISFTTAQFTEPVIIATIITIVPFILAMALGRLLSHKLDEKIFRYALISILVIAAVNLLIK